MTITASLVKELREKSGAGMMDCKTALTENNGDIEAAMDWLRSKGIAKAEKKSGRVAAEGLIGMAQGDAAAVLVEVNSETDFVAKNEQFQDIVRRTAETALGTDGSVEAISAAQIAGGEKSVADTLTDAIATIGENMTLRRAARLSVDKGVVATYMHNAAGEGLGKIGVLVALESEGDPAALAAIGKQVAMHVAATNPLAATKEEIPADVADRERAIYTEQAAESGKPAEIIEKMVEGRMRKFFEESVLLSQTFVIDGETKVEQAIKNAEKDAGAPIALKGFVRMALGEGIDKKEDDFAAEVASMAKN
ncbi:translation elongation factor Ts [Salaquimonas pukyongi]|uniref:translation elongation factor Ts n=1 Tax=Salaquimonas pukyongi TaxID=2712698 RepID=UPI00096BC09A|nr:translation elongation factor Ts [Salaquimonas pukyongi]